MTKYVILVVLMVNAFNLGVTCGDRESKRIKAKYEASVARSDSLFSVCISKIDTLSIQCQILQRSNNSLARKVLSTK